MHSISGETERFNMADNQSKKKTKAEMLLELESIKGLLNEEDDIPILQESLEQLPIIDAKNTIIPLNVEQQDLFNKRATIDSAAQLLNTLNDLAALTTTVTAQKTVTEKTPITLPKPSISQSTSAPTTKASHRDGSRDNSLESIRNRSDLIKATGENPFLPEHIRTRLHGNNPPPFFEFEMAKKIASVARPTTLLGNTHHNFVPTLKPSSHQEELIDEVVEIMLPEIARELRERLAAMSKEMLEILLAERR